MIKLVYKIFKVSAFIVFSRIDTALLKLNFVLNGVVFESGIKAYGGLPSIQINRNAKMVKIGKQVIFNNYNDAGWSSKCSFWVREKAELIVDDFSGFNGVLLYAANRIVIGKYVKVGGGTRIFDTDFHPLNYEHRRNSLYNTKTAPVQIEDDVFIGTNCIICKGVHIGARSIVAAGSVVVKDIPSDEIWGGNPARFIRKIR